MNIKTVRVGYHYEDGTWWAESPDLEGWTAVGESFDEVRRLTHEGVLLFSDGPVVIEEEALPVAVAQTGVHMVGEAQSGTMPSDAHIRGGAWNLISTRDHEDHHLTTS